MKLLVINGVNLNMLGKREIALYGKQDYKALVGFIKTAAKTHGVSAKCFQSNSEGDICTAIQKAYNKYDGIIINAGAYTHTSVAILDALKSVNLPTVEVHLTDITKREDFRQKSYISLYAEKVIVGKGFDGYKEAIEYFLTK
ncbi:MAG: type II 3-dehydroquinate dehydratase [Clostridiales bacterium]|nr:type II 3-dehydroquinate dehydratase [Clostridiales bacterium]